MGPLMAHLWSEGCAVAIYTRRSGSDECLVGTVASLDTGGRSTNEPITYDLDQVIAVDWGNGYLDALSDLRAAP